jgi:hypothetical protein
MTETIGQHLAATLRSNAQAYAAGDQTAPCVLLWTDPKREWEGIMPQMQDLMPELYLLGGYAPAKRSGPAIWLRCIEARVVEGAPPAGTTPVFYLPGLSREELRGVEDCTMEVAALVELQFRGVMWMHENGREWTPQAYLVSKLGGLGLDVAKNQATQEALAGALPVLLQEPLSLLEGRRLDADFLNSLLVPDANGVLLQWLSDPEAFQGKRGAAEWKAFGQQCKTDFKFDPVKDGPLKAAQLLAGRANHWGKVWKRFTEGPASYPGVVTWLKRAAPAEPTMFDSAEVWPDMNLHEERKLAQALESLVDRPQGEVIARIAELETEHAGRRKHPWAKLNQSPLALLMEPLAELAQGCGGSPGAPTTEAFGDYYATQGWKVDAAALGTLTACGTAEQHGYVLDVLRAVYLPWLEATAQHLQQLIRTGGQSVSKRHELIPLAAGRLVLFADGLRMDVARWLGEKLTASRLNIAHDWDWSTIPSVTASAKPAASPVAGLIEGGPTGQGFSTQQASSGQDMTHDRFLNLLKEAGWQCLKATETGDPSGSAWTEAGALDKRGHNEGWKLARSVEGEIRDLVSRIRALLKAGWKEIILVTDHGWLLLPGGLPKVELKAFLTEDRWGRCAAMKSAATTDVPSYPWHWNPVVEIACPPGVGCYRAGIEYTHGGVSLQEMVIPRLRITSGQATIAGASIKAVKWTGAKCRVDVQNAEAGMQIDLRTALSDPASSLLADQSPRPPGADGKVSLFLEEDADIGRTAEIVLLSPSGHVLQSSTTIVGQ